ncbi:hypothetical protein ACI3KS_05255 [Microbacterium sp. ZW T5_45]|uniref:hypothetical protein n=1 Tax=Microbacterium sp. ZW T5_45 TaxID=3378080 RepID=UPI003851F2A4
MTEHHWIVRVHGRDHHVSDAEYRDIRAGIDRLRAPMQLVWELSGEDVRFPVGGQGIEFLRVDA